MKKKKKKERKETALYYMELFVYNYSFFSCTCHGLAVGGVFFPTSLTFNLAFF